MVFLLFLAWLWQCVGKGALSCVTQPYHDQGVSINALYCIFHCIALCTHVLLMYKNYLSIYYNHPGFPRFGLVKTICMCIDRALFKARDHPDVGVCIEGWFIATCSTITVNCLMITSSAFPCWNSWMLPINNFIYCLSVVFTWLYPNLSKILDNFDYFSRMRNLHKLRYCWWYCWMQQWSTNVFKQWKHGPLTHMNMSNIILCAYCNQMKFLVFKHSSLCLEGVSLLLFLEYEA